MRRFNNYIKKTTPLDPLMPLIHTTTAKNFRDIVDKGRFKLTLIQCPVFKEPLIYLYYGRPAYRVAPNAPTSIGELHPVCLILKPDCIEQIRKAPRRIYPFDSGAFYNKLYDSFISATTFPLDDFLLDCDAEVPQQLVGAFFQSNDDYYNMKKKFVSIPPVEFEALAYYAMIDGGRNCDDRRATVEIVCDFEIELSKYSIEGVILPNSMLEDKAILSALRVFEVSPLSYGTYTASPRECMWTVLNSAAGHLKSRGYM